MIRELPIQCVFWIYQLLIHYSEYLRAKAHRFFFALPRPKGRG